MSLINDMLRDLSRRGNLPNQALRVQGAMDVRGIRKPDSRLGLVLLLVVCMALVGGYFYFEYVDGRSARPAAPAVPVAPLAQAPAPPPQAPVAVPATLSITEESSSAGGFTLRLAASERVGFEVLERSTRGLILRLHDIGNYTRGATSFGGMSVLQTSAGVDLEFELNHPTDFEVAEDAATPGFDLLLSASFREVPGPVAVTTSAVTEAPAPQVVLEAEAVSAQAATNAPVAAAAPPPAAAATPPPATAGSASAPGRVNRELSLDQQDRNNSQAALQLVQAGRVFEAYEQLLTFIGQNPAAHQSRETLATLLLAQQEIVQATAVLDEGLAVAPNYTPYRKLKARVLLANGSTAEALALLRAQTPVLAQDPEYHELLATLYQQSGEHDSAVTTYQNLLRHNSQQGRWWTGLAISLEARGSSADALASYQAALQTPDLDAGLRQYSEARVRALGGQR